MSRLPFSSYLLLSSAAVLLVTAAEASAQTCVTAPSCSELGYTKSASDCTGKTILYCPFDKTKAYCVDEITCASLGFTDTISECPGEYTLCPSDSTKGKCIFEASPGDLKYSLRTSNHNGWLLCNGSTYSSSQFPDLYAAISGSFGDRLPNYTGYFLKGAATSSASTFKTAQEAGLPNITAYGLGMDDMTGPNKNSSRITLGGAFYVYSTSFAYDADSKSSGDGWKLGFDASKSNSIYGKSSTVTPQNYSANVFIYAGRVKSRPSATSCAKGNYLYSDGTCSATYSSSKTLLGMIAYIYNNTTNIEYQYTFGGIDSGTSSAAETACKNKGASVAPDQYVTPFAGMSIPSNSVVAAPVSGRKYWLGFTTAGYFSCSGSTCTRYSTPETTQYYYCDKSIVFQKM